MQNQFELASFFMPLLKLVICGFYMLQEHGIYSQASYEL